MWQCAYNEEELTASISDSDILVLMLSTYSQNFTIIFGFVYIWLGTWILCLFVYMLAPRGNTMEVLKNPISLEQKNMPYLHKKSVDFGVLSNYSPKNYISKKFTDSFWPAEIILRVTFRSVKRLGKNSSWK